jgi:hypothetical protein
LFVSYRDDCAPSPSYISALSTQIISYTITTPKNAIMKPNNPVAGPNFEAPPVAVVELTLLVALVTLAGLVALILGRVMGGVPKLLKLVDAVCEILTGPGPVGIIVLRMLNGNEGDGKTEVMVRVRAGLRNVSVTTVVIPLVGTENVLPDFVPLNVPMMPFSWSRT